MSKLIIAIDGPAGAGKTTIAKRVAADLGLTFLDTGAMYRCVALKAIREGLSADKGDAAAALARSSQIKFLPGDPQRVILDGEDITDAIREPKIGDFASKVSVHPGVRRVLVQRQQAILDAGNVILEGRDTTTVVAPHAPVKIFLTASIEERAHRRFDELIAKGMPVELQHLTEGIAERDRRDSTRTDSPLKIAEGAHVIDTDQMTIEEVVSKVEELASQAQQHATPTP